MTYTWNAWGICIPAICIPDYGCHLCLASPHNYECIYVQHLAEYLWTYFSEDTGVPVCWICHMHPIKIYSNIRFQNISSWSDICNICLAFWTECDGNSSTSFSKIGLYEIKRQESTRLRTFLFCVVQIEIASPTACDQGQNLSRGFMFVGGSLESLQLILEKEYVEYIIIFFTNIQKSTCEYSACTIYNKKYFLRCYSATWGYIPETISRKLEG